MATAGFAADLAGPASSMNGNTGQFPAVSNRSGGLPMWTKLCVVLGATLVVLGFGGLGAAYAMDKNENPPAQTELVGH